MTRQALIIGTAGWSLPRAIAPQFAGEGTHLERYARVLRGVEINSSFYRAHSRATYAKWAAATPRGFRFAVKLPQSITHEGRLRRARAPLQQFLGETAGLGGRLGPLLIQLPPSLAFELRAARNFLALLRGLHDGAVVCEPRHLSWFTGRADDLLAANRIGRVAADPASVPVAAEPGGWRGLVYYRLHGSPDRYWSVYEAERIAAWAEALRRVPRSAAVWCIFDNTAGSGALGNALQIAGSLRGTHVRKRPE